MVHQYIKRCFVRLHYLNKSMEHSINVTGSMFPAKVWSLGFVFPVGGWIGSLIAAVTVERYGRKLPSIGFCLCAIIGSSLKFVSRYIHIALLFVGRFFDGISSGTFKFIYGRFNGLCCASAVRNTPTEC
ncbi:hypothetical protein RF11_01438 [Thelohanellus kitauei]|uniref:Major facilitator superfamily (MFS) profile domain-containing protein n=1 Tax=Thelohanellus kitauei TaxID=669202 RepID=A0A0C2M925_THEKT|nr:hypothetical protein RF11_01438 [Thelohanellus kitauei]